MQSSTRSTYEKADSVPIDVINERRGSIRGTPKEAARKDFDKQKGLLNSEEDVDVLYIPSVSNKSNETPRKGLKNKQNKDKRTALADVENTYKRKKWSMKTTGDMTESGKDIEHMKRGQIVLGERREIEQKKQTSLDDVKLAVEKVSSVNNNRQSRLGCEPLDMEDLSEDRDEHLEEKHIENFSIIHQKIQDLIESLTSTDEQVQYVILGGVFHMKTWYRSSYPSDYSNLSLLHICDGCFTYFRSAKVCLQHMDRCEARCAPPGSEIYRDVGNHLSVFLVDGKKFPGYCTNLCLFAMLYLKDKIVYDNMESLKFYLVCDTRNGYFKTMGYYSQEQFSARNINLGCLFVFPCYQGKGLGSLLIDLSYLVSRLRNTPGGPERPLSALGEHTYTKYWSELLLRYFYLSTQDTANKEKHIVNLKDIAKATGMVLEDIMSTIVKLFSCTKAEGKRNEIILKLDGEMMQESKRLEMQHGKQLRAKEEYLNPSFVAEIKPKRRQAVKRKP